MSAAQLSRRERQRTHDRRRAGPGPPSNPAVYPRQGVGGCDRWEAGAAASAGVGHIPDLARRVGCEPLDQRQGGLLRGDQ